jgi:hypothetical protein
MDYPVTPSYEKEGSLQKTPNPKKQIGNKILEVPATSIFVLIQPYQPHTANHLYRA